MNMSMFIIQVSEVFGADEEKIFQLNIWLLCKHGQTSIN